MIASIWGWLTMSYALVMSRAATTRGEEPSRIGATVARAVAQYRPGQKPCYSALRTEGSAGDNQRTKMRISNLYHTEVTLMGRRFCGRSGGRSEPIAPLGIAVSKVAKKQGWAP